MPQTLTGGAEFPEEYGSSSSAGNTNQGAGSTRKQKKRRRNGRVEYRWPNGTWHSRPFGKQYRSNAVSGGGGGGGNATGGSQQNRPSQHPYLDAARNEANLTYGGAENSLRDRGLAIPVWFQNYRNQLAQQQAASTAYGAPIVANAQAQAQAAGQVAPGVDPSSQAGGDAALAAAARAALGNSFVTMLQGFGSIQNQYMEGRKTVASTAELGAQQDLSREREDLRREKGQFIQKRRGELKDEAHQRRLENAAFGLDVQQEANDQANEAADRRQDRKSERNEVITSGPFAGFTKGEVRRMSPEEKARLRAKGGSGGGGNFTPKQQSEARKDVRTALNLVRSELKGKKYAPAGFWQKAYDALVDGKGYDPLIARAVIQIARHGKAKSGVLKRIRRDYGIGLPTGKPMQVPPPYVLRPVTQSPAGPGSDEFRPG